MFSRHQDSSVLNRFHMFSLLTVLFLWEGTLVAYTQKGAPTNQREFKALCWFYSIAQEAQQKKGSLDGFFVTRQPWDLAEEIKRYIEKVDLVFNQSERGGPLDIKEGDEHYYIPGGKDTVTLRAEVGALTARAGRIAKKIEDVKNRTESAIKSALGLAERTIFGAKGVLVDGEAKIPVEYAASKAVTSRQAVCRGADNEAACTPSLNAGCSIVHDMFCLCADGGGGGLNHQTACGVTISDGITAWTGSSGGVSGGTPANDWAAFKGHCQRYQLPSDLSQGNIAAAIVNFEKLLGSQVAGASGINNAEHYAWVLGKTATQTGHPCGAASGGQSGQCVDYRKASGDERAQNLWLEDFKAAKSKLGEATKETAEGNRLLTQLEFLQLTLQTLLARANATMTETTTGDLSSTLVGGKVGNGASPTKQATTGQTLPTTEGGLKADKRSWKLIAIFLL